MLRLLVGIIVLIIAIISILVLGVLVFVFQELDLFKPFLIATVIVLVLIVVILKS